MSEPTIARLYTRGGRVQQILALLVEGWPFLGALLFLIVFLGWGFMGFVSR